MNPLSILIAQSSTGSVIIIILLLVVAGVIGFFTAWLYSKSIYTPVVKRLEDEKDELNRQISGLKDEVIKLNSKIDKLNDKISELEKERGAKKK